MARIDNAEAIRDRAYAIWEREGRPSGREHEHWAEAASEFVIPKLSESVSDATVVVGAASAEPEEGQSQEMDRLRRALYEQAEFTEDASGDEQFLATPANDATAKKPGRRAIR